MKASSERRQAPQQRSLLAATARQIRLGDDGRLEEDLGPYCVLDPGGRAPGPGDRGRRRPRWPGGARAPPLRARTRRCRTSRPSLLGPRHHESNSSSVRWQLPLGSPSGALGAPRAIRGPGAPPSSQLTAPKPWSGPLSGSATGRPPWPMQRPGHLPTSRCRPAGPRRRPPSRQAGRDRPRPEPDELHLRRMTAANSARRGVRWGSTHRTAASSGAGIVSHVPLSA